MNTIIVPETEYLQLKQTVARLEQQLLWLEDLHFVEKVSELYEKLTINTIKDNAQIAQLQKHIAQNANTSDELLQQRLADVEQNRSDSIHPFNNL